MGKHAPFVKSTSPNAVTTMGAEATAFKLLRFQSEFGHEFFVALQLFPNRS